MTQALQVRSVAVIGAGLMGHGIAQEFALHGLPVHLHSRTQSSLDVALANIEANLERLQRLGAAAAGAPAAVRALLHPTRSLEEAVAEADLVVESVPEDLAVKRNVFARIAAAAPGHAVLASNTSSLMPSSFADAADPSRVLITHYVNPPYLVPLVEVVPCPQTAEATINTVISILREIGKSPVLLRKEAPGFVANRLQMALLREALEIVQQEIATAADVDVVLRTSLGRRWAVAGVFEVLELAGLDLVKSIADELFPHLARGDRSPLLDRKVIAGELGAKSGAGFHTWSPDRAEQVRTTIAHALVEIAGWQRKQEDG